MESNTRVAKSVSFKEGGGLVESVRLRTESDEAEGAGARSRSGAEEEEEDEDEDDGEDDEDDMMAKVRFCESKFSNVRATAADLGLEMGFRSIVLSLSMMMAADVLGSSPGRGGQSFLCIFFLPFPFSLFSHSEETQTELGKIDLSPEG